MLAYVRGVRTADRWQNPRGIMATIEDVEFLIANLERAIVLAQSSNELSTVVAKIEQALDAARCALADKLSERPKPHSQRGNPVQN